MSECKLRRRGHSHLDLSWTPDPRLPDWDFGSSTTKLSSAGLSGQASGARVYMNQTKISQIQTGRIIPSITDMVRAANTEFRPGRLRARARPAVWQWDLQALEAQCQVQRHFLPTMVTGLI